MEKLNLQIFRNLKQEIVEFMAKFQEADERGEYLSDEETEQFFARYKEIIKILSEHDLSDIDFEEWRGMHLAVDEDIPLDFSKTNANIDFSIIEYDPYNKTFPNFKSCQIKNFNFEKYDYSPEMFDEEFREQYPDLFLSEEVPESVRNSYYSHYLSFLEFSGNLQYFEGKTVAQSFGDFGAEKKIISLYGEGIYQLFADYKPVMDKILNDYTAMQAIEVPTGPITEEQRKEIMSSAISAYFIRNGFEQVQSWKEIKMVQDFTSLENLPLTPDVRDFIEKYGIDKLIKSGIDIKYLFQDKKLTSLEEISSLKGIELEDIKKLMDRDSRNTLDTYDVKQLLEYGIKDLSETTNDLYQVKEMLEKRPMDLINMGRFGNNKKEFIERYGIDNIIALDEETGGMFSYPMWKDDIYLTLLAHAETKAPKLDTDKKLTYEEFRNRAYEILLHARDERGPLQSRDYPDYDFIQGKFREEHPDIFIDGDLPEEVKIDFYTRHLTAEKVRQHPELVQLLQGKDLSRAFAKEVVAGFSAQMMDKDGKAIGGLPKTLNMAQCLSEKLGQEEFLKICVDYGKCLDNIEIISTKNEITVEGVRETIESAIYEGIKRKGIEYFEDLPISFQEKHPELFLPKDIDEELRTKFYEGRLTFEDVRKNLLKELLLTKVISVGFGKIKYGQPMLGRGGRRYVNPMWEILPKELILDFAEKYGKFFSDIDQRIFKEGQNPEEREGVLQDNIEENILSRKSTYDESTPEFFKQRHPEMFLDENAPDKLKQAFYDNNDISFQLIKEHPEWREFLQGKDLSRAFSIEYSELFKRFDSNTIMKLGTRNPETIEKMVQNHKENVLEYWYKSTGGKFTPHHVVMLNFPEGEIDSFLRNSKKWSQLMKIDNYNLNDDGKTAILKASYAMGVFQGDDEGFNKTMKIFTDIPQELSQEEYDKVNKMLERFHLDSDVRDNIIYDEETINLFRSAYTLNNDGKYVFSMDKQKNKDTVKIIRGILETAEIPRILTSEKANQMFDSFAMEYNPDFVRFFNENIEEILSNPEYTQDIATMQRQFSDIVRINYGRRLTLNMAKDYIKNIAYTDIEIGNEGVAERAKIASYSQKDFEALQNLFNEGEVRDFSSIPRIKGELNGYTYEMLRCDDPLALTIGYHTNCCQELHGPGQTSMEHSVVSPDGRVFCVRDPKGGIVAQSWVWRNQYTICFDNIEISNDSFKDYERQYPNVGRKGLTTDVLEVYKKAAQDLMQEDKRVYQELLENGTITQEQYDALLLGKVTIGAGYNDVKDALREAKKRGEFGLDTTNEVLPIKTDRLPVIYDDSHYEHDGEHDGQYTLPMRDGIVKSDYQNVYVHQDDVPVFDGTNMSSTVLLTMKRMEQAAERDNLAYLSEGSDEKNFTQSQRIINSIAREYGLDPNSTKVMATARIALIYSKDKDKIKIGELLTSPVKKGLTDEQKQNTTAHIMYQVKKALKQMGVQDSEVDLSSLSEEEQQMLQSVIQEIEKENDERGEK